MSSETITRNDLANILNEVIAIDGTDMTSQEVDTFINSLDYSGTNVQDIIESYLSSKTTTVTGTTGGLYFYRTGNVVYFSSNGAFRSSASDIASSSVISQTVPTGYRPVKRAYVISANPANAWRLEVGPDGSIMYYGDTAWNSNMYISGSWITADDMPAE